MGFACSAIPFRRFWESRHLETVSAPFAGGRILFFEALAFTGRTGLVGGALGVVGQFVIGAAPLGTYFTDTINNFFALAGWAGGTFFFGHVFLLVHECVMENTSNGFSRFFFGEIILQFFQRALGQKHQGRRS